MDTILDYECECPAYETYYGLCKHCVATALIYRSRQARQMADKMQAANGGKIQKGVPLDCKTSDSLRKMIETYAVKDRFHLFGGHYHTVNLQPEIRKVYRGYEIEFKIGEKKMYVLKNIPKLLDDTINCNYVSYGKNFGFQHDRSAFTEETLGWIDRMTDILRNAMNVNDFQEYTYSSDYRCISLRNYAMERILTDFLGKDLEIDGRIYQIVDEDPKLVLKIKPRLESGARLSMEETEFSTYLSLDERDERMILASAEVTYGNSVYNVLEPMDLGSDYRNLEKEKEYIQVFHEYFISEKSGKGALSYCREDEDVYRLVSEGMDALKELGSVFLDEKLRGIKIMKAPQVAVGVSLVGNLLEMDVTIPQMDMREIYEILSAYRRRKKYFRLKNGDFIQIEDNGLAVLSELTQGLSIASEQLQSGKIELPMYRTSYIDTVLRNKSEDLEIKRDRSFKQLVRNMRDFSDSDFEIPEGVCAKLRTYQKDGFRWLCTLAQWGFGGILADDMGLGKTLQMLTFLWYMKKKALIVCPASLVYNWASEAHRFIPDCRVAVIGGVGTSRQKEIEESKQADITITSYDLLKRDVK